MIGYTKTAAKDMAAEKRLRKNRLRRNKVWKEIPSKKTIQIIACPGTPRPRLLARLTAVALGLLERCRFANLPAQML